MYTTLLDFNGVFMFINEFEFICYNLFVEYDIIF